MERMKVTISFLLFQEVLLGYSSYIPSLKEMIKKDFGNCEVVFVNAVGSVKEEQLQPHFYDFISGGNYIVWRRKDNVGESFTFRRLDDVHRYNVIQCAITFIRIGTENENGLSQWLFDTVTPRYVPIVRKDEDAFVFLSESLETMEKILVSSTFGNRIKLKVGIVFSPKPTILKLNLFQNDGLPSLTKLRMEEVIWRRRSLFPDTTRNLHSKIIRVAVPRAPSAYEMQKNPDGIGYRPKRGLYKVWIDGLMDKFNFTIHLQPSTAWSTGKKLPNGTWIGAVGDIMSGTADMAPFNGHIYIRHPFVDWSVPLNYEWLVFITHKPTPIYKPAAMFHPFPLILWVGFFISMIAIFITIKVITVVLNLRYSFTQDLLFFLASFMEEGAQHYLTIENIAAARTLIAFWLSYAIILSTCYKGKLVSMIAFPQLTWVPTTLDELAFSDYRVGLNVLGKGGSAYSLLSTSTSPSYKSLFERMEIYPDASVCLKTALKNDIGCLMWQSVSDYTAAKNFTDKFGRSPFMASTQTAAFHEDGCIWEKRALFAKKFNEFTWSVVETGIIMYWTLEDLNSLKKQRLERERRLHPNKKFDPIEEDSSTLRLEHLMGIIYISVACLLSASVSLVGEILYSKYGFSAN